jgi:hypothetical protein
MVRKSERPTVPPEFDVAKYAKDSDENIVGVRLSQLALERQQQQRQRLNEPASLPRSETRLSTRPSMGAITTDEAWARSMTGAPVVVVPTAELVRLPLDHRAGFLLSRMDGFIDLDTLVEVSSMRRADALRLVRDLCESGIVEFR